MMEDDFMDIEDEIRWEQRQKYLSSRVSLFEKRGWGFNNFKTLLINNFYIDGDEDYLVYLYQSYISQDLFISAEDWAEFSLNATN